MIPYVERHRVVLQTWITLLLLTLKAVNDVMDSIEILIPSIEIS